MSRTHSTHGRPGYGLALCLLAAFILVGVAVADGTLSEAEKAYERHNYRDAMKLAEEVIASDPDEDTLFAAKRLKAMSTCRLPDKDGREFAATLMEDHPELAEDAEFLLALAWCQERRGPRDKAFEHYKAAGEVLEKADSDQEAAQAYLKAAEMLLHSYWLPQPAQQKEAGEPWHWQQRRRHHVLKAAEIYEHVAELDGAKDLTRAQALYTAGQRVSELGDWEAASKGIELFRRCAEDFPKLEQAAASQFAVGHVCRNFGRYTEAIAAFEKVRESFPKAKEWIGRAKDEIEAIKRPQVTLAVKGAFLPDDELAVRWQVRNIDRLRLTARPIDLPEALKRVKDPHRAVREMTPAAGEPEHTWTFDTPDEGKHQWHQNAPDREKQTTVPIRPPVEGPGAWLITAEGANPDGKSEKATCLVVVSKLAAVAKMDADQALLFVADADTGEPAGAAAVTVVRDRGDKGRLASGKTNDAGLAELELPRVPSCNWIAAVRDGKHQAITGHGGYHWHWWGWREPYKVYGFTARPVYRPGQTVHFKQVIRHMQDGVYHNVAGKKVRVKVINPKGETIYSKEHVTDEYGALTGSLAIGEQPPLGVYRIQLNVQGHDVHHWYMPGNRFRVEEYKKPEFKVSVEPDRPDYRVGDEVRIKISADYYYGQPVSGGEVSFTVRKQSYNHNYYWPRPWHWYWAELSGSRYRHHGWGPRFDELVARGTAQMNDEGEAFVTVEAEPIEGHEKLDLQFAVQAEVTDASRRVIRSTGSVKVTHAPFFVYCEPARHVYGPGDSVEVKVRAENPSGQPVMAGFRAEVRRIERIRQVEEDEAGNQKVIWEERLAEKVHEGDVQVDENGRARFRFTPDMTGRFRVTLREIRPEGELGADPKPVEGTCELWVASKTGAEANYAYNLLRIVPASDQYEIGETMRVLVNTSRENSRVLLTGEADDLLFHRVVHVEKNSKLVEIDVDKSLCPNFTLTATMLRDEKVYRDAKQIVVPPTHRFLDVEVQVGKGSKGGGEDAKYQPREEAPVQVKLTDRRTGKPVVGQVALMMVDSSVYYIQPEFREQIEKSFYGFVRHTRVSTMDSYYGPARLAGWPGGRGTGFRGPVPRLVDGVAMRQMREAIKEADAAAPAPAGRPMAKGRSMDDEGSGLVEPMVRKEFRDTVLWAGAVETDADGMAEVPVTMPDQLTTFALHAIAVDKDTRVGQTRTDVITTKRVIVRLESGRFFTEGDHSYVTLIAHNYYDEPQQLRLDLKSEGLGGELTLRQAKVEGEWRDYDSGQPLDVTVAAGGEVRVDFKTTAARPGDVKLTARALGARESDAYERTKPIVPWGASKLIGRSGAMTGAGDDNVRFNITVPEAIGEGSQSLTVTLKPSLAAVAMDALPYLARYPYGCTEQTMSRFLPTVVVRQTLDAAGVDLDDIREMVEDRSAADPKLKARYAFIRKRMGRNPVYSEREVEKMIADGLNRLKGFQHGDGGWGWWRHGSSDPYMTAYVTFGLVEAQQVDVHVADGMINRAADWLVERAARPPLEAGERPNWWWRHTYNDNTRAFMHYVIGRARGNAWAKNEKLTAELDRLFKARDRMTDYGRAYLALALHSAERNGEARTIVENFQNTVTVDEAQGVAHWGDTGGWWYWYQGATETTAWVLQAMLTVDPDHEHVPMAANWLVQNRRGVYWHNTKGTAMAVYALARYARKAGELDCDQTYTVLVDGRKVHEVRVRKDNLFTFPSRAVIPAGALPPGEHTVEIRRSGKGNLYWGGHLRYFDKAEVIEPAGHRIAVTREYFRLVPEEFENTRQVWKNGKVVTEKFPDLRYNREPLEFGAEITTGQRVEVKLTIEADENLEYVVFEDPKPSGCEPFRLVSGSAYGDGMYANMELRDTKVAFFASWVPKGERELTYTLVCEQPGTFRVLPSSAEAMYTPFIEAISGSGLMTITPKPDAVAGR